MHEAFLTRLASHPVFRNDHNFRVFLEYDQDLAVRSKNKIEMFEVRFHTIYTYISVQLLFKFDSTREYF